MVPDFLLEVRTIFKNIFNRKNDQNTSFTLSNCGAIHDRQILFINWTK